MTIQIELQPEAEARLNAEARERGLLLNRYFEEKLNDDGASVARSARELSSEERKASLDALARYSDRIPSFSMESFSREALYEDHDFLQDNRAVYREWRRLVVEHRISGVQVHDARLAAAMYAHGLTHILTANTGDSAATQA